MATNFEKYQDDIVRIVVADDMPALINGEIKPCSTSSCQACSFDAPNVKCTSKLFEWLYSEYKEPAPKLTLTERHFCETFLEDDRLYLARDQYDNLYLYDVIKPPIKNVNNGYWSLQDCDDTMLEIKKDLFLFIKWEDEKLWSIPDLLKLEVEE